MRDDTPRLEELDWAAIAPRATSVPKELQEALRTLLKDGDKVWAARYPYSDLIVSNGSLTLPAGADSKAQEYLQSACGKASPPLCLVLSGSVEVFLAVPDLMNTFPLQVIGPGEMFGVFEAIDRLHGDTDTPGFYSAASGCVSIRIIGTRLKDRDLPGKVGTELLGKSAKAVSWNHRKEPVCHFIRKATETKHPWYCDLLILPAPWVQRAVDESRTFERLLYRLGWDQSSHARHQITAYTEKHLLQHKNAAFGPLVQHLQSVLLGQLPAFRLGHKVPRSSGPFSSFQNALYEVLCDEATKKGQIPQYPFIVQPAQLRVGESGFYSFNSPLPYLTVRGNDDKGKNGVTHCKAVLDIVGDKYAGEGLTKAPIAYRKHFKFFCNGADGKPYKPGKNPIEEHHHHKLKLNDFFEPTELENVRALLGKKGKKVSITENNICLTDDFLTTGVMICR